MTGEVFLDSNMLLYACSSPLSQWDATILAAAKELGCEVVYSEDMNHGQDYGGVRVTNPFK